MGAPEKSSVLPGFMPNRLPEGARPPQDFKPIDVAKELLRTTRSGALATLDRQTAAYSRVRALDPHRQYRGRCARLGPARLDRQGRPPRLSAAHRARRLRE